LYYLSGFFAKTTTVHIPFTKDLPRGAEYFPFYYDPSVGAMVAGCASIPGLTTTPAPAPVPVTEIATLVTMP
jgi:hypothetical protein